MKQYVNITGYGLCEFKPKEKYQLDEASPLQYKGEYKLPKNTTYNGKEWVELDYYFSPDQITKYPAINNKEIHQLLIDLGLSLADFEFKWPEELRKKFNKITNATK